MKLVVNIDHVLCLSHRTVETVVLLLGCHWIIGWIWCFSYNYSCDI